METPDMMDETWLGALACAGKGRDSVQNQPAAEAHKAVDSHLDGNAGHDGRDVARRVGVRRWQPYVQWKHAGLYAEAKQGQPEQRSQFRMVAHRTQVPASRAPRKHGEDGEEKKPGHVRCR